MKKETKHRILWGLLVVWPAQFISIPQAIVGILTGGYYVPSWEVAWMFNVGYKVQVWLK